MNRRGFFKMLGGLGIGAIVGKEAVTWEKDPTRLGYTNGKEFIPLERWGRREYRDSWGVGYVASTDISFYKAPNKRFPVNYPGSPSYKDYL